MIGPTEDALGSPEKTLRGQELETVHRNELRLLKLVNTLLDFSRIEAGRVTATFEATDLPALTADLASAFRSAIERAGLRVKAGFAVTTRRSALSSSNGCRTVSRMLAAYTSCNDKVMKFGILVTPFPDATRAGGRIQPLQLAGALTQCSTYITLRLSPRMSAIAQGSRILGA